MREKIKIITERVKAGLMIALFADEWCVFARHRNNELAVGAHMTEQTLKEIYEALGQLEGKDEPKGWE